MRSCAKASLKPENSGWSQLTDWLNDARNVAGPSAWSNSPARSADTGLKSEPYPDFLEAFAASSVGFLSEALNAPKCSSPSLELSQKMAASLVIWGRSLQDGLGLARCSIAGATGNGVTQSLTHGNGWACERWRAWVSGQSHERKVGNRRWRHWTKISAKSVTKKNPCLPSTFSSKMPPCEMFVYFRNFLKKHLVTPYSSNGSGLEDKNRSFSFFSLIEKNSKHISSSIFSRLKLWQRKNRTKNWRLTKIS